MWINYSVSFHLFDCWSMSVFDYRAPQVQPRVLGNAQYVHIGTFPKSPKFWVPNTSVLKATHKGVWFCSPTYKMVDRVMTLKPMVSPWSSLKQIFTPSEPSPCVSTTLMNLLISVWYYSSWFLCIILWATSLSNMTIGPPCTTLEDYSQAFSSYT